MRWNRRGRLFGKLEAIMDKRHRESSKNQRQLIAMACAFFGISKEDKKAILKERYGKESTTQISFAQADEMLDDFVGKGFKIQAKRKFYKRQSMPKAGKGLVKLASPAELSKIEALSGLITWQVQNGFEKWMKKRFDIDRVRTARDAFLVIEGLKKMFAGTMARRFGADWWAKDFPDIEVCRFIVEHHPAEINPSFLPAVARVRENAGRHPARSIA